MIHSRKRFEEWMPAHFDGEFAWDFLKSAFYDSKIMPMDFDAVVERRGHFLVFETKAAGKNIDKGQSITLTTAWRDKGSTVVHVEGKTPKEITGFAIYSEWEKDKIESIGDRKILPRTVVDLAYAVRAWFCKASGIDKQTREAWERDAWVSDYENGGVK